MQMQIFYLRCKCPMQGWKCKVYSWWCQRAYLTVMHVSLCRDGDANFLWCKCLLMGMSWCKCSCRYAMNANVLMAHAMMRMSTCGDAMNANARWGMQRMQMPPCGYIMTRNVLVQTQFIQKFLLFSKRGFHNAWNQNIFKLDLLFLKSHLLFDLRLPKKIGDHY